MIVFWAQSLYKDKGVYLMQATLNCTNRLYVCSSERIKLIGSINGFFPDLGHHEAREMIGMWLHPIKLFDGFWLRLCDHETNGEVNTWIHADRFTNYPFGNEFFYSSGLSHTCVEISRFQFAPEEAAGCVVKYTFKNRGTSPRHICAELLARTDLRPVWFSESIGVVNGPRDEIKYDEQLSAFHAKDCDHEWHCMFGADIRPTMYRAGDFFGPENTSGNGVSGSLSFDFTMDAEEEKSITFYFAGSCTSKEDCTTQYTALQDADQMLAVKKIRYEKIQKRTLLTTGDTKFQTVFGWIKVHNDWLIQDVPGLGRGLTAGIPEYPWWFGCDNSYSLQGVLATGDFELCRDTLLLLLEYSEKHNDNGRILHEVTTFGAVPNHGNTQETAHFIPMVWKYYQWTGDWSLVERCIPYMSKSIDWLIQADDDKDLFPSGYGITEIAGLNMEMIDSAVYTYEAYVDWAEICRIKGWEEKSKDMMGLAQKLKDEINRQFWDEREKLYCDAVASFDKISDNLSLILDYTPLSQKANAEKYLTDLLQAKRDLGNCESGWVLHKNWVIATPMEVGIAPCEKAQPALQRLHTNEFIGEYGAYLNALHHDAIMTISTGVYAVAQARYGHADRSLDLLERMFRSFSMATPGSISEMSPDYGCFVQAWTIYAVAVPVVNYFFGITPSAKDGYIAFYPNMPAAWEKASLQSVRVVEGKISIEYSRDGKSERYYIVNETGLDLKILPQSGRDILINGKPTPICIEVGPAIVPSNQVNITIEITKKSD
jgi:glycogen debranching enzyme